MQEQEQEQRIHSLYREENILCLYCFSLKIPEWTCLLAFNRSVLLILKNEQMYLKQIVTNKLKRVSPTRGM